MRPIGQSRVIAQTLHKGLYTLKHFGIIMLYDERLSVLLFPMEKKISRATTLNLGLIFAKEPIELSLVVKKN